MYILITKRFLNVITNVMAHPRFPGNTKHDNYT